MTNETPADVDNTDTGAASGMAPAERIRELNDELRKTGVGGKTYLTRGLIAKGADFIAKATAAVRALRRLHATITTRGKSTTARRSTSTARRSCSRSIITT